MSDAIVIPNIVGRLDPVTLSACLGKRDEVIAQLKIETSRQFEKKTAANKDSDKAEANFKDICNFIELINSSDKAWNQFRRACGWTGDDAGAAVGAKVMRVEELREGDVVWNGVERLTFQAMDEDRDLEFCDQSGITVFEAYGVIEEDIKRGREVYRNKTLISGWPADKHPEVEEAARLREENVRLKARDDQWCSIATEHVEDDDDYPSDSVTSPFELDMLLDLMRNEIAGSELKARSAEDENTKLKAEIERLKAAADEPELDESRVIQTFYDLADQHKHGWIQSGNLWTALRCIIRSIYSGSEPQFKPYKLKK
jgi:hypothetical protein